VAAALVLPAAVLLRLAAHLLVAALPVLAVAVAAADAAARLPSR
jgi:hypothetical protein